MTSQHPSSYGDVFADVYDAWYHDMSNVDATVAALVIASGGAPVLELGIGTGRLALPLAAAGIPVVGLDASPAMLQRCRAKPGGEAPLLVVADMAAPPLRATFETVFVAFNTIFNLTTHADQQACIEAVAGLMSPTGSFLVEANVPSAEPAHVEYNEAGRTDGAGGRILTTTVRDPRTQTVRGVHIHTDPHGSVRRLPWTIRYLHPAQLDALCEAAGLELTARWSDWSGESFDDASERHVSRYSRRPIS